MLEITLIVFRECFKISILIALIMSITKGVRNSRLYIVAGVMLGIVLASIVAFCTKALFISFGGRGDEIFNCIILFGIVVLMTLALIFTDNYSVITKHVAAKNTLDQMLKEHFILLCLIGAIILYTVAEIIMRIYAISSVVLIDNSSYVQGLTIGSILGFATGGLIYLCGMKFLNPDIVFKLSEYLLILIISSFSSEIAGILNASNIVGLLSEQFWDSSWLISERSIVGCCLKLTIGYAAKPTKLQILVYVFTLIIINGLIITKRSISAMRNQVNTNNLAGK